MATSSVDAALLAERFGPIPELAAERSRPAVPRPSRGLAAARCLVCHINHDNAVVDGRYPQPVRRAVPGTDRCEIHTRQPR
jgi:hypothetical protein